MFPTSSKTFSLENGLFWAILGEFQGVKNDKSSSYFVPLRLKLDLTVHISIKLGLPRSTFGKSKRLTYAPLRRNQSRKRYFTAEAWFENLTTLREIEGQSSFGLFFQSKTLLLCALRASAVSNFLSVRQPAQ